MPDRRRYLIDGFWLFTAAVALIALGIGVLIGAWLL